MTSQVHYIYKPVVRCHEAYLKLQKHDSEIIIYGHLAVRIHTYVLCLAEGPDRDKFLLDLYWKHLAIRMICKILSNP